MSDTHVVSFAVFKQARDNKKRGNAAALNGGEAPAYLRPAFQEQFVAFSAKEQQEIISLHQKFSGVSRDYNFTHQESAAFITLLACALTREALIVFEKRANAADDNAPFTYAAYNFDSENSVDIKSTDIKDIAHAAAPFLAAAQEKKYKENHALANQNAREYAAKSRRAAFGIIS